MRGDGRAEGGRYHRCMARVPLEMR